MLLRPHRFGEGGADIAGGVDAEVFDGRCALALGELENLFDLMNHMPGRSHNCSAQTQHRKTDDNENPRLIFPKRFP